MATIHVRNKSSKIKLEADETFTISEMQFTCIGRRSERSALLLECQVTLLDFLCQPIFELGFLLQWCDTRAVYRDFQED